MAVCTSAGSDNSNAEIESETNISSVTLSDFVKECSFPQCVCVTEGSFLSRKVQISRGDVLLLKSFDNEQVTLSYQNDKNFAWTEVNVPLNYPGKFKVLPPKDTSNGDRVVSLIMYPTIADLLLDCPTYFEATAPYDDPYLPGISVRIGDRFRIIGIVKNPKDGVERLKVQDSMDNNVILSPDCRGHFYPLRDEYCYTIKELVDQAPVQRRLIMVNKETTGYSQEDESTNNEDRELSQSEYTDVNKVSAHWNMHLSSTPSSFSNVDIVPTSLGVMPPSFSGIIHLLKPESTVAVSPYDDLEITWTIPVSANLKVRLYSQDEYEIPKPTCQLSQPRVPLPLSLDDESPTFRAPSAPPLTQPLVPIKICNFVDIYCSSFPVKAKVVDTSEANPFFQKLLNNVDEIVLCKFDEMKRLYVKDTKSDTVYSLSHDVRLSFIEYPEKFTTISELLHLPIGSEVTVLEDIAADFPKPFSLRFGDVLRLTSNVPYLVKTKVFNRECLVIKCERIDPEGGVNVKLKLPLDFEVSMVITTNPHSRRLIPLQDLLSGITPIPSKNVASISDDTENVELNELPVDLRILKSQTERCVVAAASSKSQTSISSSINTSSQETTAVLCSSHELLALQYIGLPLTSGIVLAFRERLDVFKTSEMDYIRLPVEKMTLSQFEEWQQKLKPKSDYEDIESSSNSTVEENGAESNTITRTSSNGILERRQKSTKMDKVRRLSRALNPKHWRHTKTDPEPLPHPSVMGLIAFSGRSKEDITNEYQEDKMDSKSVTSESTKSGSSAMDVSIASSEVEEENLYEDVEICTMKSSTTITTSPHRTGTFSGQTYRSLPPSHTLPNQFTKYSQTNALGNSDNSSHGFTTDLYITNPSTSKPSNSDGGTDKQTNSVPKPFARAKNWATNLGNNIGNRFTIKPKEDTTNGSNVMNASRDTVTEASSTIHSYLNVLHPVLRPPDSKPPMPPTEKDINNKTTDKTKLDSNLPIPLMRQKNGKLPISISDVVEVTNGNEERELAHEQHIVMSANLNESNSSSMDLQLPKPKPRGLKNILKDQQSSPSPQPRSRQWLPKSGDEETCVDSNSLTGTSEEPHAKGKCKPKPPPKPRFTTHTTV